MKYLIISIIFLLTTSTFAQKPCDFTTNVVDSIGSYKATKEYLMYEKNFAGNSSYVFTSIVISDGTPILNVQFLEKSNNFIKAKCFDKNSRLYIQLDNSKIVTLFHIDQESCGSLVRDDKGMNNRVLTGYFMFRKGEYEELKKSTASLIRVKYATDVADFIIRKAIKSELDGSLYEPDSYFMNYIHCLEDKN
ncbi:hypothetical protein [Flavobacterium sp.]|uniref:hypothetical protein n=1 Tax=Flavobacterium sp. TaxID=239 RepID=UPI00286C9560|nr:hypothetical protein [Flavobacterium sp.]